MAFDQSTISGLSHARDGKELLVSWSSSAPDGTTFQVYVQNVRVASTPHRYVHLPWPGSVGRVSLAVGTVAAGEEETDFSGSLPSIPHERVTITWIGGTYLDPAIAGYRVYGATSGTLVLPANLMATIPAYTAGIITDGYGEGGYGDGGYGESSASYTWTSNPLPSGAWTFAIVPYNAAGNVQGSPSTTARTISRAPLAPAPASRGSRLGYTYNATTHVPTLTWQASAGP